MVGVKELLGKLGAAVRMSVAGPLFYVTNIVCHFLSCIAHVDGRLGGQYLYYEVAQEVAKSLVTFKVRLPFSSIDRWFLRRSVLTFCTGCSDTLRTGLNNRGDWLDTLKNHKLLRKDLSVQSLVVRLRRMRGFFTRVARDVKRQKEFGWMSKRVNCPHVFPLQQTW